MSFTLNLRARRVKFCKCVKQQNENEKSNTAIFTNKTLVIGDVIFIEYSLQYCELPSNKIENQINLKCNKYACPIIRPRKHFFHCISLSGWLNFYRFRLLLKFDFFEKNFSFNVMKISVERLRVSIFWTSSFNHLVLTFALFPPFQSSWLILCVRERWHIPFKTVGNRGWKFAGDTVLSSVIKIGNVARSETFGGK